MYSRNKQTKPRHLVRISSRSVSLSHRHHLRSHVILILLVLTIINPTNNILRHLCIPSPFNIFLPIVLVESMVLRVPLPGGRSISFNQDTGVLRINLAAPSETNVSVPPLGTEPLEQVRTSIEVKDTGTAKGFGAFCRLDCGSTRSGSETEVVGIPSGSFLGFYSGEVVTTREELDAKIAKRRSFGEEDAARNAMDYVMSLDGGLTFIDGYERYVRQCVDGYMYYFTWPISILSLSQLSCLPRSI
jgi:hypothetical protein